MLFILREWVRILRKGTTSQPTPVPGMVIRMQERQLHMYTGTT